MHKAWRCSSEIRKPFTKHTQNVFALSLSLRPTYPKVRSWFGLVSATQLEKKEKGEKITEGKTENGIVNCDLSGQSYFQKKKRGLRDCINILYQNSDIKKKKTYEKSLCVFFFGLVSRKAKMHEEQRSHLTPMLTMQTMTGISSVS